MCIRCACVPVVLYLLDWGESGLTPNYFNFDLNSQKVKIYTLLFQQDETVGEDWGELYWASNTNGLSRIYLAWTGRESRERCLGMYLWWPAFFSLSSLWKVSRKSRSFNTVCCYCFYFLWKKKCLTKFVQNRSYLNLLCVFNVFFSVWDQ